MPVTLTQLEAIFFLKLFLGKVFFNCKDFPFCFYLKLSNHSAMVLFNMEIVLLYVNYGLMKNLILFMTLLEKRPQKISMLSLELEILRDQETKLPQ